MTEIDRRRRFVFRGNAAAVGGRIVHPEDVIIESSVASSLTVAGGRSHNKSDTPLRFGKYVEVGSAEARSDGLFDKLEQHLALTRRQITADALSTSTEVHAEVRKVVVGAGKPKLTIERVHAGLRARSALASGEASMPVVDSVIEGIDIGGHRLIVTVSDFFTVYDTHSKVLTAVDDLNRNPEAERQLLLKSPIHGTDIPPNGRLLRSDKAIYGTVIGSIKWAKKPYPGATITDHIVRVPGFGKLLFGELFIADSARRLTMLRLELGSPQKGDVAFAEVETNGIWS